MQNTLFFRLLRIGLETETIDNNQWKLDDFLSVDDYQFSVKQGVGAFIFDGLQKATEASKIPIDAVPREVKMKFFSHTIQVERLCKSQYVRAVALAELYAKNNIRTVVLKGIATGHFYPNSWHRPCGDFDCYLMGDFSKGNKVAQKAGAEVEHHSYKHSHIEYKGLMVENHQFCTAFRGSKKAKRFELLLQDLLHENRTQIGETHLECPSSLFNALFLTHHGRDHFIREGITLRHLCDWAMLLHKHSEEIDWTRFMAIADEYDLRKFADAMTRLSEELIGIAIPVGYDVQKNKICEDILRESLIMGLNKLPPSTTLWGSRLDKVLRFKQNAKRLRLFMNMGFAEYVGMQFYGILFDRIPKHS